jgi:hypothetical protein
MCWNALWLCQRQLHKFLAGFRCCSAEKWPKQKRPPWNPEISQGLIRSPETFNLTVDRQRATQGCVIRNGRFRFWPLRQAGSRSGPPAHRKDEESLDRQTGLDPDADETCKTAQTAMTERKRDQVDVGPARGCQPLAPEAQAIRPEPLSPEWRGGRPRECCGSGIPRPPVPLFQAFGGPEDHSAQLDCLLA